MKDRLIILKNLSSWIQAQPLKYPWQQSQEPYYIWVSEIMLQQTVVTSVVEYFKKWMERFPTLESLAEADQEEVLRTFEGLGYYSRARNMHKCAKQVIEKFEGKFPCTYKELISLSGIGDYTARAILSFCFQQPYLVVDANVKRVIKRLCLQLEWNSLFESSYKNSLKDLLGEEIRYINEGIMRLGQEVCLKRKPLCLICPLREACLAREKGQQELVTLKKKREITLLTSIAYVIVSEGKIYLEKENSHRFKDLWLLPKESLQGEFFLKSLVKKYFFGTYWHTYTRYKEKIEVYVASLNLKGKIRYENQFKGEWFSFDEVSKIPMPSVYRHIICDLKEKNLE